VFEGLDAQPRDGWNILANQVGFAPQDDLQAANARRLFLDPWDGYLIDRQRVLDHLKTEQLGNTVVITGDKHQQSVRNVPEDYRDIAGPPIATEFIGTSISSGGNGFRPPRTAATPTTRTSCSRTSSAATCEWNSTASTGAATSASSKPSSGARTCPRTRSSAGR
jgi:phosphodiesterase/alkaline phosphatase D-like protein